MNISKGIDIITVVNIIILTTVKIFYSEVYYVRGNDKKEKILDAALNGCGLWENHVFGLALGPLRGMALELLYKRDERNDI